MILLTGFYLDPEPSRCGKFLQCIRRNEANDAFDEIRVCVEDLVDPTMHARSATRLSREPQPLLKTDGAGTTLSP